MKRWDICYLLAILLSFCCVFIGCDGGQANPTSGTLDESLMFTDADLEDGYGTADSEIVITLSGKSATCSSTTGYVKMGSGYVIISGGGLYVLTGSSENLIVYVQANKGTDKVKLVLRDLSMTHSSFAPIYVKSANKTFIYVEGTNTISTIGAFVQKDTNNVDGCIFSKDDLAIKGNGYLNVNCSSGHGVVAKDDLKIINANLNITSLEHGIDANDSVRVSGANIVINAGQDGIKVENIDVVTLGYFYFASGNLTVNSLHDGVDCSYKMLIKSGNIKIFAGNSGEINTDINSKRALKATGGLSVLGGNLILYSSDNGLQGASFEFVGATIISFSAKQSEIVEGISFNNTSVMQKGSYNVIQNSSVILSVNAERDFYNLLYISPTVSGEGFLLERV